MAVRTPAVTVAGSALLQSVAGAGELLRRHHKNLQVALQPTKSSQQISPLTKITF